MTWMVDMNYEGVSVIIPTNRYSVFALTSLESVCESLESFKGEKELILCVDRKIRDNDGLLILEKKHPFVNIILNPNNQGSAYARNLGLQAASYGILIFTDDDCFVEKDWVERLYENVSKYGICTGGLKARNSGIFPRLEEYIDHYRIHATDKNGHIKFISFPNFGIKRELLPDPAFDVDPRNTVEDIDLACRLRLLGHNIHLDDNLIVKTIYPGNLTEMIRRKFKHARGISYLQKRMGVERWEQLEIGSIKDIIKRWYKISFNSPFPFLERVLFFVSNMSYCLGLYYYTQRFKNVEPIDAI